MKKVICIILMCLLICSYTVFAAPEIDCRSAILVEASTGKTLFEHNPHEALPPASVTKIMTMLLTMEAIDGGNLSLDDIVTASENAKSYGGSTIFLDAGEQMSVNDLLKGIAVASGNDACVAIAEHISGSESSFVEMMNNRARELGMNDTNFENCNGLDTDGHVTSAYDIALMSRELLKHEKIFDYTTIWTDTLRDGKFNLANTNKLIRFYNGANGLKTGSTSIAGSCISATAKRDGLQLIAVVLNAPNSSKRFESAKSMLDWGFANYTLVRPVETTEITGEVKVAKGLKEFVTPKPKEDFEVLIDKTLQNSVTGEVELVEGVEAPVSKGDEIGKVVFYANGEKLGECPLVAAEDVPRKTFSQIYLDILKKWLF